MTEAQGEYLKLLQTKRVVIAEGPAGTGKTFMAVTYGLKQIMAGKFEKLIVTRRAIEADDDKIGFLPGDKNEKLYEYMRPSISVIAKHLRIASTLPSIASTGFVEIEHLGSLRGMTFENSFIVLDEAQNTTDKLMKMFLTRMGRGCQAVICGDLTQNDLPRGKKSGLAEALRRLPENGIFGLQKFSEEDVQRSDIVSAVLAAWPDEVSV